MMARRSPVEPDPLPDDYKRPRTPAAALVLGIVAELADRDGIAPVASVVSRLVSMGTTVRDAQGMIEMLSPSRLHVLRRAPVDPSLEFATGENPRPWTHTRIVSDEERAKKLAAARAGVARRERRRAERRRVSA